MASHTKDTLSIYWRHAARYPWRLSFHVAGVVLAAACDLYQPFLFKRFFDALGTSTPGDASQLLRILLLIGLLNAASWVAWRLAEIANNYFQPRVMSDLLNTCFQYLEGHSYTFFNNSFAGSLVRRVNRFADSFEDISDQFTWEVGQAMLRVAATLVILAVYRWQLALVTLVWAVVYLGGSLWFSKFKLKYDLARAEADTKSTGYLSDTITNNLNVKIFARSKQEAKAFTEHTETLYNRRVFSWNLDSVANAAQGALMAILEVGLLFVAIKLWQGGHLTIGDFALVQGYLSILFGRLWNFGKNIRRIYQALSNADEMTEILTTPYDVADKASAKALKVKEGGINFAAVKFGYADGKSVLKEFTLSVDPGEKLAIIGPSGGGKSTIVKLLLRFLDIRSGQILIDGQNIAEVTQDSLRSQIAFVPQEPMLFHRSLLENIRYAKPEANNAEVLQAAKLAHCHEFISRFPDGYNTLVGERGVKLSGGERQRVAIARAILKDAPILVLDEATSSLDSESERYIQAALRQLMAKKTTIVIAHRLSTIMQMDRIVVLDKGKIIEQGRHEQLLELDKGVYQKLWEIQAGSFATV